MGRIFIPDFYINDIYSINFDKLKAMGIKNLIIDIDNTLMPWGSREADDKVKALVNELKGYGFNICLLSNSSRKRVLRFMCGMEVEFFSMGIKPMRIKFMGALGRLKGTSEDTCVIGDQVFTDILGGNRCGLYTILVDPIVDKELFTTKYIRMLERRIRKKLVYERKLMKDE